MTTTRDPRAEAHRARQRAMRDTVLEEQQRFLDEATMAIAVGAAARQAIPPGPPDTDATELSGADTDRPDPDFGSGTGDTMNGTMLGDMGFTRADIDAAIARDVIAEHRETVELYRESLVFLNNELETDLNHVTLGEILARNEFPDGTWDVRITAVRRGE